MHYPCHQWSRFGFFLLSFFSLSVNALPPEDSAETQLINIVSQAEAGEWEKAGALADTLCEEYPDFRAAKLLQQLVQHNELPGIITPQPLKEEEDEFLPANIEAELTRRIQGRKKKVQSSVWPNTIIKLNSHVEYALLIDLGLSRLYLMQNHADETPVIADYYVGIGKQGAVKTQRGDLRTPVGIYTITGEMSDAELDELYGAGSWPLNYPNSWDRRLNRGGGGIWIHGVPRDTYSRTPYSSRGCITLSNHLFEGLKPYIEPGKTPVIITDKIIWTDPSAQVQLRDTLMQFFQQWINDWISLDFNRYIGHYSEDFNSGKETYEQWKARKHAINLNKKNIDIETDEIAIYAYPGENSLVQIDYLQNYRSNNFNATAHKRLYLKRETDEQWRIVYEGLQR